MLLRRGASKDAPKEDELEGMIERLIRVFKFVNDKDVFQRLYSRSLAKRYIVGTSLSEDLEQMVIVRLKNTCGHDYTSKMQRMSNDMDISTDLNTRFGEAHKRSSLSGVADGSTLLLSSGYWPLGSGAAGNSVQLPADIAAYAAAFEAFYQKQFSGRRLTWLYPYCRAEVRVTIQKRRYDLQVTAYQMAVLLLFTETESHRVSFREALDTCGLEDRELVRTLKVCFLSTRLIYGSPSLTQRY